MVTCADTLKPQDFNFSSYPSLSGALGIPNLYHVDCNHSETVRNSCFYNGALCSRFFHVSHDADPHTCRDWLTQFHWALSPGSAVLDGLSQVWSGPRGRDHSTPSSIQVISPVLAYKRTQEKSPQQTPRNCVSSSFNYDIIIGMLAWQLCMDSAITVTFLNIFLSHFNGTHATYEHLAE